MILRLLALALIFAIPLSGAPEKEKFRNAEMLPKVSCNCCRQQPSAAELLQDLHIILNNGLLLLPQLQPQLIGVLDTILAESTATGSVNVTATGLFSFADFFALMPGDNAATVGPGTDVSFPQDGPNSGNGIFRLNATQFNLSAIGVYQVLFQVSVTEAGQLVLTLDSGAGAQQLAYTVVGRATGTSQIVGMALVQTSVINSILTVRNPAGESTALTITPLAGGVDPVSAHLVITRIK